MNLASAYQSQFTLSNKFVQIGLVLEEVSIQFLVVQGQVGFYIIAEFDYFHIHAILSQTSLNVVQDFGMGNCGCTHLNSYFFVSSGSCLLVAAAASCHHSNAY